MKCPKMNGILQSDSYHNYWGKLNQDHCKNYELLEDTTRRTLLQPSRRYLHEKSVLLTNLRLKLSIKKEFYLFLMLLLYLCHTIYPISAKNFSGHFSSLRTRYKRNADSGERCEKITIPLCKDIGYNLTDISLSPSNIFEQTEVATTVNQFQIAVQLGCAEELKLLVCAIYTPVCIEGYKNFMPPCRHICDKAKQGCGPVFRKYGVSWPELLRCENFPEYSGENQMCLHFNHSLNRDITSKSYLTTSSTYNKHRSRQNPTRSLFQNDLSSSSLPSKSSSCTCQCRHPMVTINDLEDPLYNKVVTGRQPRCAMSCRSPYFTRHQLDKLQTCIAVLSVICFVVTSVTIGTFWIDGDRFKYPEKSVVFLSLCYMFVSLGFLIRIAAGHEAVACGWQSDKVLYKTSVPFLCGLVYFLIYFFSMAGCLWWVILSCTWFLSSGLKWSSEAIKGISQWFHALAWPLPAIKIVLVIGFSLVGGDPVSGICFVGNQNVNELNLPILVPMIFYLSLGFLFLLFGFFDLCRIRSTIKKAQKKTNRFDKLMGRIAGFSLIYIMLSAILISCFFYEHNNRDNWANAFNCRGQSTNRSCFDESAAEPHLGVFIIKFSSFLLMGVANGIWICSRKTIRSWKKFYKQSIQFLCNSRGILSWFKKKKSPCQKLSQKNKYKTNIKAENKLSNSSFVSKDQTLERSSEFSKSMSLDSRDDPIEHEESDYFIRQDSKSFLVVAERESNNLFYVKDNSADRRKCFHELKYDVDKNYFTTSIRVCDEGKNKSEKCLGKDLRLGCSTNNELTLSSIEIQNGSCLLSRKPLDCISHTNSKHLSEKLSPSLFEKKDWENIHHIHYHHHHYHPPNKSSSFIHTKDSNFNCNCRLKKSPSTN